MRKMFKKITKIAQKAHNFLQEWAKDCPKETKW